MAALDADAEVAHRADVRAHHMKVNAENAAEHPYGIADALRGIDRIGDGDRMQRDEAAKIDLPLRTCRRARHFALADRLAVELGDALRHEAARIAGGKTGDDFVDGDPGHALSLVDGGADRLLHFHHVDNGAAFDAAAHLMTDTNDVDRRSRGRARIADFGDEAGNLGRADVERGDDARTPRGSDRLLSPAKPAVKTQREPPSGVLARRFRAHGLTVVEAEPRRFWVPQIDDGDVMVEDVFLGDHPEENIERLRQTPIGHFDHDMVIEM